MEVIELLILMICKNYSLDKEHTENNIFTDLKLTYNRSNNLALLDCSTNVDEAKIDATRIYSVDETGVSTIKNKTTIKSSMLC